MISENQQYIIDLLNDNMPHWEKWYRWDNTPFTIQEQEMFEILFVKKLPLKALQLQSMKSIQSVKRNMQSLIEKIAQPEIQANYMEFIEERIETVPIPKHRYDLFLRWEEAVKANTLELLEKKITKAMLQ